MIITISFEIRCTWHLNHARELKYYSKSKCNFNYFLVWICLCAWGRMHRAH